MLTFIGAVLVFIIMVDAVWTTLTTRGSGFLAGPLTVGLRWVMRSLSYKMGNRNVLAHTGTLTIITLVLFWLCGLWLGWGLIFIGMPGSVIEDGDMQPANLVGYFYFVGFTLSTLGIGDLRPVGDIPRILTSVAAFNGLILVTLMISYAIPLLNGVISRRKLAFHLSLLGDNMTNLVLNAWNGKDFRDLESTITLVSGEIIQCAENRLAYPVLDYFYSYEREFSLGLQLATVDEALNLLVSGIDKSLLPAESTISNIRKIIQLYLTRCHTAINHIEADVPPLPSLSPLSHSGLSLQSDNTFETSMAEFSERRRLLHKLVLHEGWEWADVSPA